MAFFNASHSCNAEWRKKVVPATGLEVKILLSCFFSAFFFVRRFFFFEKLDDGFVEEACPQFFLFPDSLQEMTENEWPLPELVFSRKVKIKTFHFFSFFCFSITESIFW